MQSIEYSKYNHPILYLIYSILAALQKHGKHIIFCKVSAHIGIKDNEAVHIAAIEVTEVIQPSGGLQTPNGKKSEKTVLANFTILNHVLKSWKVPTIVIDTVKSN